MCLYHFKFGIFAPCRCYSVLCLCSIAFLILVVLSAFWLHCSLFHEVCLAIPPQVAKMWFTIASEQIYMLKDCVLWMFHWGAARLSLAPLPPPLLSNVCTFAFAVLLTRPLSRSECFHLSTPYQDNRGNASSRRSKRTCKIET